MTDYICSIAVGYQVATGSIISAVSKSESKKKQLMCPAVNEITVSRCYSFHCSEEKLFVVATLFLAVPRIMNFV